MSITYGFFNSINGDRKYNAEQMSAIFDGILNDGIFANIGEAFKVTPGEGLQVLVHSGRAWIKSTWTLNDGVEPLDFNLPDVSLSRIDAVVIEVDHSETVRANTLKVVMGTPGTTPRKPTLTDNGLIKQVALAYVTVKPGTSSFEQGDIETVVGKSETPFVTGILQVTNLDTIFAQWDADFHVWFDNVKSQLEGDVATNLLKQIEERVKISDKASVEDVQSGMSDNKWVTPYGVNSLIADKRTYIADKDVKAGDVLDVLSNGRVGLTERLLNSESRYFTLGGGNGATSYNDNAIGLGDGKYVWQRYVSGNFSLVLDKSDGRTNKTISSLLLGNTAGSYTSIHKIGGSKIVVTAYFNNVFNVYIVSYENDTLSLVNSTTVALNTSITLGNTIKISDDAICLLGYRSANSVVGLYACIVDRLSNSEMVPRVGDVFSFVDTAWATLYEVQMINVPDNKNRALVIYRAQGGTAPGGAAFAGILIDLENQRFLTEYRLADYNNEYGWVNPKLRIINGNIYSVYCGGSSGSSYYQKLVMRQIFVSDSQLSMGDQCLSESISLSTNTSGWNIEEIDGVVICVAQRNVYEMKYEAGKFSILRTMITIQTGNTNNVTYMPNIIKISEYMYSVILTQVSSTAWSIYSFIFCVYNGVVGIYPIFSASECIALKDANRDQKVEVIFSGTTYFPDIKSGEIIYSDGVYGVATKDDNLTVFSKDRPNKIIYGSYIGDGLSGDTGPTQIIFSTPVKFIIIYGDTNPSSTNNAHIGIIFTDINYGVVSFGASKYPITIAFENNVLYIKYTNNANVQLNTNNIKYNYVAFS